MDYLQHAKTTLEISCSADEEAVHLYVSEAQVSTLIAIAEQLQRIADAMERNQRPIATIETGGAYKSSWNR